MKKLKKYLRYFLFAFLSLALVFFFLGFFFPSFSYESSITVNKPAPNSFTVFTNVFLLPEWIPGLKKVEWESGLPNQPGSKWKMFIMQDGTEYVMTETLTSYKKNELFAFTFENGVLTGNTEVRFTGNEKSCLITSKSNITGKNFFWKSLLLLSQSYIKEEDQKAYDNLKKVIEKNN